MSQLRCPNCDTPLVGSACPSCGWSSQPTVRIGSPQQSFNPWPYILSALGLVIIGLLVFILLRPNQQPVAPVATSQPIIIVQSPVPGQASTAIAEAPSPTQEVAVPTKAVTPTTSNVQVGYQCGARSMLKVGEVMKVPAGTYVEGDILVDGIKLYNDTDPATGQMVITEQETSVTVESDRLIYIECFQSADQAGASARNYAQVYLINSGGTSLCGNMCRSVQMYFWPSRKSEFFGKP